MFVHIRNVLWVKTGLGGRVNVILFSHLNSPWSGSRLPPKPLPVDDLQGRLCCCCRSTEELITRQCRGFVLSICPSLASGRQRERKEIDEEEEKEEEKGSYLSLGVLDPFIPDCLGDLLAPPGSSRPSAAALVYCPIMTLSTATIRPLIARCRPPQWVNGSVMGRRIRPVVILKSSEALSYLVVCAGER